MRHPIRMFISHCFELFSYQTFDQLKRFILFICVLSFHRFVCDSNATGNFENRHCLESEIIKTICYLKIILYIRFKCRYKSFLESSSAIFFQKNLVFCRCTIFFVLVKRRDFITRIPNVSNRFRNLVLLFSFCFPGFFLVLLPFQLLYQILCKEFEWEIVQTQQTIRCDQSEQKVHSIIGQAKLSVFARIYIEKQKSNKPYSNFNTLFDSLFPSQ